MNNPAKSSNAQSKDQITILLVDDIPETRENIKKLLAFEPDFKVVGSAGTGREGVDPARELHPNIIIMDINMPDMDGLQATTKITEAVPTAAVIMMSVQNDADYLRRAMLAGARDFLTKPIDMDELYNTIRQVHERNKPLIAQYMAEMEQGALAATAKPKTQGGERAGHVIVVYSPQGGSGKTTVATSLASGLMKEGIRVLLVDANLQFGDVAVFLNLQAQSTILDLVDSVEDLDTELFENIVVTHETGLKVLMGPPKPELADEIRQNPGTVGTILQKVAGSYDFIVVDTASSFDEVLLPLLDMAAKVVLIGTPTLNSVKNVRFVLDLFDQLGYAPDKTVLTLNRTFDPRQGKQAMLSVERIQAYLKRPIEAQIPFVDERVILSAINKGVPVVAADRDTSKPPIKQLLELSELLFTKLMPTTEDEENQDQASKDKKRVGLFGR
jgi:pilus assembly protein CpaE